jgi:hypothetical protein
MKQWFGLKTLVYGLVIIAITTFNAFAQGGHNQHHNRHAAWPDSLAKVTLEGVVLVDTAHTEIYFLDVNNDSVADYHLLFGPTWYVPESGATLPVAGALITLVGTVRDHASVPQLIVLELNGLVWRESIENWWDDHQWRQTQVIDTLTGVVLVDTTYFYTHYFLDTNADSVAEYQLCFGAPWYEPEIGAVRPEAGETVTVTGMVHDSHSVPCIDIFTVNDVVWRDPSGPAPWAGEWIHRGARQHQRVHCPTDTSSWLSVPPGAMTGGGHHGSDFPDSVFCQFREVYKDSMPGTCDSLRRGWHIQFNNPSGQSMHQRGSALQFMQRLRLQINYCDSNSSSLSKTIASDASLYSWNESTQTWEPVTTATYNSTDGSFTLEVESIGTYYAVFEAATVTTSITNNTVTPTTITLEKNYPNPFNPSTTIRFQVNNTASIVLTIFNSLGQQVKTLLSASVAAGVHEVTWDGTNVAGQIVPSGMYFYRMNVNGSQVLTRNMVLLK